MNFTQQQALAQAQAAQRNAAVGGGLTPQQQQQMAMAQQMAAQYGGAMTPQQQQQIAMAQQMAAGAGVITPQQQQQIAMAQQMAAQYGGAAGAGAGAGGITPQQQQQIAMAQQLAAQYGGAAGAGGITPQQQQQIAMAQQMAAQYGAAGGMTPQQQQQLAMAQQLAAQYGAGGAPAGGAPGYAPPSPSDMSSTTVSVTFPDGCMLGYDKLRGELILNGKTANTRIRQVPARPSSAYSASTGEVDEGPATPVEKRGVMTKLGWKKNMLGADSWQPRHFHLTATGLSYAKDASGAAINTIALNNGVIVNVVSASTPARKNRYENNDNPGVVGLMSQPIGQMRLETSGPIGRDNCVEMIVPGQIGSMLDGVMANNAIGMAFGGGLQDMKHAAQGRTYYMSCGSREEADEWKNAITNNVRALPTPQNPGPGGIGGANGYAGLNGVMNNAMAMKNTMNDAKDPSKTLEWYKRSLGTKLSNDELFACLTKFYNELDRNGVRY